MFNRFFPMFKNIAAGVAEGTTWKDFAALAENLQQIIEIGDGLDSESSNEELFAFLSGGVLSDSLIGDVIE